MNIDQAMSIYAGGPGSGPNAPCPQCGPKGEESGEKFKGPKGKDSPAPSKDVGNIPLPKKGKEKGAAAELYKKWKEKQEVGTKDMQQWLKEHHTEKQKAADFKEGDIVKLKKGDTLYNYKTGNIDKFGPGLKAVVVHVLPKVGDNPQLVKVNILPPGKKWEPDQFRYMKAVELDLHRTSKDKIEVEPVKKSQVLTKFKTSDGADVTWVKPHVEGEHETKTIQQIASESHHLKGNFELTDSVKGMQDRPGYSRVTKIYDTTGMPSHLQTGSNATVMVNTYYKQGKIKEVVIQEINTTNYAQKSSGLLSFTYKVQAGKFGPGAAAAVGMLKSRYGITTKLSRLSKAKYGE